MEHCKYVNFTTYILPDLLIGVSGGLTDYGMCLCRGLVVCRGGTEMLQVGFEEELVLGQPLHRLQEVVLQLEPLAALLCLKLLYERPEFGVL